MAGQLGGQLNPAPKGGHRGANPGPKGGHRPRGPPFSFFWFYRRATSGRSLVPVALAEAEDALGLVARGERDVGRDVARGGRGAELVVQGEEILARVDPAAS